MIQNNQSKILCSESKIAFYDFSTVDWDNSSLKIFKIKLSDFENKVTQYSKFLQEDEINKAKRYRFKKDSNRFIICRAILKFLLSRQINKHISEIIIQKDHHTKPFLPSYPSQFFNISHSQDYALIAIGNHFMGIDIEKIDSSFNYRQILSQTFNKNETDKIFQSKNPLKTFYTFWTRKEALVKATGIGIDDSFKNVPAMGGIYTHPKTSTIEIGSIQVIGFEIENNYIGALALPLQKKGNDILKCYNISSKLII